MCKTVRGMALALLAMLLATISHADPPFVLTVKNGAMTQGGVVPTGWDGKFGDVEAARDTQVYHSAPASLRVSCAAGKNGSAFQSFQGGANVIFKIDGWFKTAGNVKAQVMVQAFADGYKQNQFIQVLYQQGASDWTHFTKEVTLPAYTAFFNVGIMAEGDGRAWLDDVHEASSPLDAGQVLTPTQQMASGPPGAAHPDVPGWGFYP